MRALCRYHGHNLRMKGRRNVSIAPHIVEIAQRLMAQRLKGNNFTRFLEDLILEEHRRCGPVDAGEIIKLKEEVQKWKDKYRFFNAEIKKQIKEGKLRFVKSEIPTA